VERPPRVAHDPEQEIEWQQAAFRELLLTLERRLVFSAPSGVRRDVRRVPIHPSLAIFG
jgi:hypothetical protein